MTDFVIISTTTDDRVVAETIARSVVESRLAACAGITPTDSVYRWSGEVCSASEFTVTIKTTSEAVAAVQAQILSLHDYELAEIIVSPIVGGSEAYLAWIREEVDVEAETEVEA